MDIFNKANQVNSLGTLFKPTAGQKFVGTYIGSHEVQFENSKFGGDGLVTYFDFLNVTIDGDKKEPSERYAVKGGAFLANSLKKMDPQVGWIIGLEYKGKVKNKFGTDSDSYDVYGGEAFVDPNVKEWLSMTPTVAAPTPEAPKAPTAASPFAGISAGVQTPPTSDQPFTTPKEWHAKIMELLAGKLGLADEDAAKEKAMVLTNKAYLPANYEAIYNLLVAQLGA